MKPYKLKHVPTGLYYQPYKHKGSNFSKRGKIYQTKVNILILGYYSDKSPRKSLWIFVYKNTLIYKEFKDKLKWVETADKQQYKVETNIDDWIIEEI